MCIRDRPSTARPGRRHAAPAPGAAWPSGHPWSRWRQARRAAADLRRLHAELDATETRDGLMAKQHRVRALRAAYQDALSTACERLGVAPTPRLSLIHISEPTRLGMISYAVFCL